VTVALRVAARPAPTVSLIDEVLRVAVVRAAPGWDEGVPRVEPERDEQDVRDAQIAQEQQEQPEQQAQTKRPERPAPGRAEGMALCDRQGMRTEWYRAKHRMMWRCTRG
jgi:hypothetical protein